MLDLIFPAFLNEKQFTVQDISKGRKTASLRTHVEHAIGRIKDYKILSGKIPISMARLANQIIYVCAFLTNFQPALVPWPKHCSEKEVEDYFNQLSDCDSDPDSNVDSDMIQIHPLNNFNIPSGEAPKKHHFGYNHSRWCHNNILVSLIMLIGDVFFNYRFFFINSISSSGCTSILWLYNAQNQTIGWGVTFA